MYMQPKVNSYLRSTASHFFANALYIYCFCRYDKYYQTPRVWLTGYDEVNSVVIFFELWLICVTNLGCKWNMCGEIKFCCFHKLKYIVGMQC
mgnify:FL=1